MVQLIQRTVNFGNRNINRIFSATFYENKRKWSQLKNKYKGKRVFLIGNGPSLNKTPLYLLKDEYTLCFNRFSLLMERLEWTPNFFMTVDATVAENIQDELVTMAELSEYSFFPDIHKVENLNFTKFIPYKDNVLFMHQEPVPGKFSKWLPYVGTGGSVIFEGFQVLKYLGFSEIYFLGVDMNYVIHENTEIIRGNSIESKGDDDPNHFDPRYFGKGKKYHQPDNKVVENIFNGLKVVSEHLSSDECNAVNIGYDSKVEFFPRKDFYDALGYSDSKIDQIFTSLLQKFGVSSVEELGRKSIKCDDLEKFNDAEDIVSMHVDVALEVIKKKVMTHVPIGPYRDTIYFVKRKELLLE